VQVLNIYFSSNFMKILCLYIALFTLLFACKKKDGEIKPIDECLTPTEVIIKPLSSEDVSFSLLGTDSITVRKVSWTIIAPDKTLQIETKGKTAVTQKFSKSGEFKIIAIVETVCDTKVTLTRSEIIQIARPSTLWIKELGQQYTDTTFRIIYESIDGGCIVVGTDNSVKIVSIDTFGNILWRRDIQGIGANVKSIARSNNGGYILGGDRFDYNYGLIKISADGEKLWEKTFSGDGYDRLIKVITTSDGGYIMAGYSSSNAGIDKSESPKNPDSNQNYTLTDYWIIKVDAFGKKEWDRTIGGDGEEVLGNIISTVDGGYVLSGRSTSNRSGDKSEDLKGNSDTWIVKINKNGTKEWDKTLEYTVIDMLAMHDGSVIFNTLPKLYDNNIGLIKLSSNGEFLWEKFLQGKYSKMYISNNGGFSMIGNSMIGNFSKFNLMHFSVEGEIQDNFDIDMPNSSFLISVIKSTSGYYGLLQLNSGQGVIYIK